MAKAQGLALNPSKISGQCGRLLCCLSYEYETYNEMRKTLPKCGKKLNLPDGTADVIGLNVLAQTLTIVDKNGRREVHVDDLDKPAPATGHAPARSAAASAGEARATTEKEAEPRKTVRRQRRRSEQSPAATKETRPQPADNKNRTSSNAPKAPPAEKPVEQKSEDQTQRKRSRNRRRSRRRPERGATEKPEQNKP
jgi:Mg-chelatase subunit ChlI